MSYTVLIDPAAELDFTEQFDYIAQSSLEGAIRWEDAFEQLKERLASNPFLYGQAVEEPFLKQGLRSAPFKTPHGNTYLAVYTVTESTVTIIRIRGQGQDELTEDDLPNG